MSRAGLLAFTILKHLAGNRKANVGLHVKHFSRSPQFPKITTIGRKHMMTTKSLDGFPSAAPSAPGNKLRFADVSITHKTIDLISKCYNFWTHKSMVS